MLDLHTHSEYSKHARGKIEEVVKSAIKQGIHTLCITDHAPYLVDTTNRILDSELEEYFKEVKSIASSYSKEITVLLGLEVDYHPDHEDFIANLLGSLEIDYVIGAVHYVYVDGQKINVWDIESLADELFLDTYFMYLKKMINSGFFDAIAHPDTIMRGGISSCEFYERFIPLVPDMKLHNVSYEINCSSTTKSNFDPYTKSKAKGEAVYPNYELVASLIEQGVSFTIGSDAHKPSNVGYGIHENLELCMRKGMKTITYYEARKPFSLPIKQLLK